MEDKHSSNTILYLSFSYDNSFLLVGTESGFIIYNTKYTSAENEKFKIIIQGQLPNI